MVVMVFGERMLLVANLQNFVYKSYEWKRQGFCQPPYSLSQFSWVR